MKEIPSLNDDLLALERSLKSKLHPVKPDQQFVGNLRMRLEEISAYPQPQKTAFTLLSVAGGLLIGLIVFLIGKVILQEFS